MVYIDGNNRSNCRMMLTEDGGVTDTNSCPWLTDDYCGLFLRPRGKSVYGNKKNSLLIRIYVVCYFQTLRFGPSTRSLICTANFLMIDKIRLVRLGSTDSCSFCFCQ